MSKYSVLWVESISVAYLWPLIKRYAQMLPLAFTEIPMPLVFLYATTMVSVSFFSEIKASLGFLGIVLLILLLFSYYLYLFTYLCFLFLKVKEPTLGRLVQRYVVMVVISLPLLIVINVLIYALYGLFLDGVSVFLGRYFYSSNELVFYRILWAPIQGVSSLLSALTTIVMFSVKRLSNNFKKALQLLGALILRRLPIILISSAFFGAIFTMLQVLPLITMISSGSIWLLLLDAVIYIKVMVFSMALFLQEK